MMKYVTQATEKRLNEMYNYIFSSDSKSGANYDKYTDTHYMCRVYSEAVALYEILQSVKCRRGWDGATIKEMKQYGEQIENSKLWFGEIKGRYFESAVRAMNYHYETGKYDNFNVYYSGTHDLDGGYVTGFNELVKFVYNRFLAYTKTTIDPVTYISDCYFGYVKSLPRWAKEAFELCGMLTEWDELVKKFETPQATEQTAEVKAESTEPEQKAEQTALKEEQENTYEHAVEMAKSAVKYGDGIQAIYFKDGEFKAGLESDRPYAEKNGWKYFHTVSETIPQEERTRAEKWQEIKEARKKSLFWAKRMSYKSADSHPEWKEEYEKAKKHVEEVRAKYEKTEPEETASEINEKCIRISNERNLAHTGLQEGLNPTKVFYKGEWRVLVLFIPIKGGHDFADRCEIRALPENSYEDIATSLENGKHGFSEWFLYDPETTNKRLKRYQEVAMKKFVAKTRLQV